MNPVAYHRQSPKIKLIACLGNPETDYKNTYHNVGHLAFDYFRGHLRVKSRKLPFRGFDYVKNPPLACPLVRPDVFMNDSGGAIKEALKYFGSAPRELLVIHDDSDLQLGRYKLEFGRGAAGHHGVESVIQSLGTKDFWRFRVGIRELNNKMRAGEFVLKKISTSHKEKLEGVFKKVPELFKINL